MRSGCVIRVTLKKTCERGVRYPTAVIPYYGGATSGMLVRDGKAEHVQAYLDHIAAGGYA